ncbi:hypothetical protein J2851_001588 [Azospirillum rugosum]|uniref:Uncharacterized protein n=1 Tax=Azospirillum rugosum TaxID=416170 RepID=A0ABS4SGZ6_9PROT|nr:hypothetical protein [Azospirillum rugosum]MDQ0524349.1 hypothetical protein [Azospirillum rugosum]
MPNVFRMPWITPEDYLAAERAAEVQDESPRVMFF